AASSALGCCGAAEWNVGPGGRTRGGSLPVVAASTSSGCSAGGSSPAETSAEGCTGTPSLAMTAPLSSNSNFFGAGSSGVSLTSSLTTRPPSSSYSKLTAFFNTSAVSRISRIGSSSADFSSVWNPVLIFLSSEYTLPNLRTASGSFSGPRTIRASSSRKNSSLPLRLNIAASLRAGPGFVTAPCHHSRVQQRLPSLLEHPIAFGHRGARAHAPENTLAGFELALKLGATGLESDVWVTADGIPVLDHDGVVRKSLGRTRPIGELRRA